MWFKKSVQKFNTVSRKPKIVLLKIENYPKVKKISTEKLIKIVNIFPGIQEL